MITKYDQESKRCPMLGHAIDFSYCRSVSSGDPCRKIFDCWFDRFQIQEFVQEHYSEDTIRNLLQPPKPKITSILELVEQAKSSMKQE